jgi:hypothetical protein
MPKISFIISRYRELPDLSDMKLVLEQMSRYGHDCKLIVYDKYEKQNDTYKLVSNIGRESFAWFDYVLETWNNPDDYYVFSHPCSSIERQDKFFKFVALCQNVLFSIKNGDTFCTPKEPHMMNANPLYSRKTPHFGNQGVNQLNLEDVKKQQFTTTKYENLDEWWKERSNGLDFFKRCSTHGLSMGSSENLHSWGKDFWEKIYQDILDGGANGEISHFLERTMCSIVAGKQTIENLKV